MAHKASTCGPVCPLVCVVPAAMSQAGMVSQQPMQMGMTPMMMVAPMAAPVMMPMLDSSVASSAGYGAMSASAWPVYFSNSYFSEEAPQQLPMEPCVPQEASGYAAACGDSWRWEAEVPAQLSMDSAMQPETTMQTQNCMATAASVGTLRHRRGQECSEETSSAMVSDVSHVDEQHVGQQDRTDVEAQELAQARELADRLLVQMQAGGNAQWAAVQSFERLAFTSKVSSMAAQIVLAEASRTDAEALAAGLRDHVRNAVQSKHANHVVQKITEIFPVGKASFIVDELKGFANDVARHIFGCRVFCRILEHLSPADASTIELVEEIFVDIQELCSHSFGSFVVRHLLEFGLPQHKRRVVEALRTDLAGYTKHKFGSHVVESALRHASAEDQRVLARDLLGDKDQLLSCAANQFGRHIVKSMVSMPDGIKKEAVEALRPMEDKLKTSRYGKSVWQAVKAATAV